MASFTDKEGTQWVLDLTLNDVAKVEQFDFEPIAGDTKISLNNLSEEAFQLMLFDSSLIFACIWCCVESQAKDRGLDYMEFLDRMNGDAVESGKRAFWEALADFFPRRRAVLRQWVEAQERLEAQYVEKLSLLMPRLEEVGAKQIDILTQDLQEKLGS